VSTQRPVELAVTEGALVRAVEEAVWYHHCHQPFITGLCYSLSVVGKQNN